MQPFSLGSAPPQKSPHHHCLVHSTTLSTPPPMESAMVDDLLRGSRGSSTPFLYLQHHTLMGVFFRYGRFPLDNRCIVHHRNASTELSALARWGISALCDQTTCRGAFSGHDSWRMSKGKNGPFFTLKSSLLLRWRSESYRVCSRVLWKNEVIQQAAILVMKNVR